MFISMVNFIALPTTKGKQIKRQTITLAKGEMSMKLKVPSRNYSVTQLYDTVATMMGHKDVGDLHYDCREINVAPNIQENFFTYYKENQPNANESDLKMEVAMMLLNYGPKTDEDLADYEVEVSDKFIC